MIAYVGYQADDKGLTSSVATALFSPVLTATKPANAEIAFDLQAHHRTLQRLAETSPGRFETATTIGHVTIEGNFSW